MKTIKFLMLPLLGLPFFTACDKEDPAFEANADVFILAKTTDQETTYAPAFYLYGNQKIKTATATLSGSSNILDLEKYQNLNNTFYKEPDNEDYTDTPPAEGTYNFELITEKNEEIQLTDQLEDNIIEAPTISSVNVEENKLTLTWDEIEEADAYIVQLLDVETDEVIYSTNFIVESTTLTVTAQEITQQSNVAPEAGKDYILKMKSYLFEENVTANHTANIQCISTRETTLSWL